MTENVDVAVVGAGVAGLRAAAVLAAAGRDVVVLERATHVGGRVSSEDVDGFVVDRGFQVINPAYLALRRAVDLDELDLQPFTAGLALRDGAALRRWGHPLRAPRLAPGALLGVARSPREAIGLARWARPILVAGRAGHDLARRLEAVEDTTLGAGLDRAGVRGDLRRTVESFLAGVVLDDPARVSQRYALLVLRTFLLGVPGVPPRGVRGLPRLMATPLCDAVRLGTEVERAERHADGVRLHTAAGTVHARSLVVATDAAAAARLLDVPAAEPRGVVTHWWATPESPADDALVHVDVRRDGPLVNTAVVSNAARGYAPMGRHLVQASALLRPGHPAPTEAAMRAHAARIYGRAATTWETVARHEIPDALPALPVPAGGRLAGLVVVDADGVTACGDHRATPSLQGALASGERAARLLLADRAALPSAPVPPPADPPPARPTPRRAP